MKIFFIAQVILVGVAVSQHANPNDLDPLDEFNEEEFEIFFGKEKIDDPEEYAKREEALKEHEEEIHKINEEFEAGEITWYDAVNEYSDLPEDEFEKEKTGEKPWSDLDEGRGLLNPSAEDLIDEASEMYFKQFALRRGSPPASFDARALGLVSPVKRQRDCGSCVAFSSMGAVETCFKKLTGVFGDYSEQQFVDCGYGINGADGCDGAPPHAYLKWAGDNKVGLAHESQYPYLNKEPKLVCPANLPVHNQGAKISGSYYSYSATEEIMKGLVAEHGAVVTTVKAYGPFSDYKGGIFAGCAPGTSTDHAVLVVGYGSENGVDYWIIKNSWGDSWGENGFIRLKRGVGMCGVGSKVALVTCESVPGPTDAPLTTKKPCIDQYGNCPDLAKTACYQEHIAAGCQLSCGLCAGMTPARSYTCYDQFNNCPDLEKYCSQDHIAAGCKKTCTGC